MFILLLLLALVGPCMVALSVVGSKFFYPNGTQFFIKGINYQLVPHDPLIDPEQCHRDIALMAELGVNAIRVYHVDTGPPALVDHRGCMKAFADAGIYVFVDLDTFNTQIDENAPHWNSSQFLAFRSVLDEFQQFDNTAGVFVGNEVLTSKRGTAAAPYVLAAAHDIKMYRDQMNYRPIPVGYSAADIAELRPMLQNYLACSPDPRNRLDFFGLNAYEWCGSSSYIGSGYMELQKNASGYPIPIFFSETGCNVARPRTFSDQAAIFGPLMADTWSGAMVYEWIQETNDYGLISYGPPDPDGVNAQTTKATVYDGFTRKGTPTPVMPDFANLKQQWETLSPTGVLLSDYVRSLSSSSLTTLPACPEFTADGWSVNPTEFLPVLIGRPSPTAVPTTAEFSENAITATTASVHSTSHVGSAGHMGSTMESTAGRNEADALDRTMIMTWTLNLGGVALLLALLLL